MNEQAEVIFTCTKRADIEKNRIIIPKFVIDKYGRYFYLNVYSDGSIKLIPNEKLNNQDKED